MFQTCVGALGLSRRKRAVSQPPPFMNPRQNSPSGKNATSDDGSQICPECSERVWPAAEVDRRHFIRVVAGSAAGIVGGSSLLPKTAVAAAAAVETARTVKPAESLIRELFATLTAEQKLAVMRPW